MITFASTSVDLLVFLLIRTQQLWIFTPWTGSTSELLENSCVSESPIYSKSDLSGVKHVPFWLAITTQSALRDLSLPNNTLPPFATLLILKLTL